MIFEKTPKTPSRPTLKKTPPNRAPKKSRITKTITKTTIPKKLKTIYKPK